ncbi:MAG: phosphotransferase [Hyphomonadaceae bacterium]|nr:phosphotransferase [Hyphomonadaceae bacterium]
MDSETEREAALKRLLVETGFERAERIALPMDASTRRYERLVLPKRTAILMDAPPRSEGGPCPPGASRGQRLEMGWNAISRLAASRVEAFAAVAQQLSAWGLSAPQIHGVDVAAGYAVLEDLGEDLYARVIETGADEVALYAAAAEVLARVHAAPIPERLAWPGGEWPILEYDGLALEANMDLFYEWAPRAEGIHIPDAYRARWERARDALIAETASFPRAFTIRDYHAENLLWMPQRAGLRRVGLLDFQDAVRGWRAWDFAMLLHDARRDVSHEASEAAIRAYLEATGATDAAFRRELAVLGVINALRIVGIFHRLVYRDGKPKYLAFLPREWAHLSRALQHPSVGEMADFVDEVAGRYVRAA